MAAILALPPELHHIIASLLSYNDLQALRQTCRTLSISIQPNHTQLLAAESQPWAQEKELLTCIACLRFLPKSRFSTNQRTQPPPPYTDLIPYNFVSAAMMLSNPAPAQLQENKLGTVPEKRFCNLCGTRNLPGQHRYQLGERWDDEYGTWYVRCVRCEKIKVARKEKGARLCFGCHCDDLAVERME